MNAATKVYYNNDLQRLIISYNICNHCKSAGTRLKNNTPLFHTTFHNIFSLPDNIWHTSVCKCCVNILQTHNDWFFLEKSHRAGIIPKKGEERLI